jgi:signal transduction histidine kinase
LLQQIENCKKINHKGKNLQYAMECLSYVYELKNDYKNAHRYFQECVMMYDSLNSIESKNKILNIEASFNISQKNKEIQFNQKIIEQEKKQKWFYIFGIGLLAIIGGLLFYQSRNRKKINEKLQLLNTELDQANKTKTRFFSILNHDLRSPVANLIHFLHLQKDSPELLDEETKNRMQNKTISGAENLLSSMEDILLWSKGQMENFKPQPKKVSVNQLFEDTKKVFSGYHKIKFEYHKPR